jgi:ligand-binding sensor domain-containing protein
MDSSRFFIKYIQYTFVLAIMGFCAACTKEGGQSKDDAAYLFKEAYINKIFIDKNKNIWLATKNGLYHFPLSNHKDIHLIPSTKGFEVNDVEGHDSTLLFAYKDRVGSIHISEMDNNEMQEGQSSFWSHLATAIHFDGLKNIWLANADGLTVIKGEMALNEAFFGFFEKNPITDIGSDTANWNYVATYGGGVSRHKVNVDAIAGASVYDSVWTGLGSNFVNTVFIDGAEQWYGTDKGASRHTVFEAKEGWKRFTKDKGLVSNHVNAIIKDKQARVWFGTDLGISVHNHTTWETFTTHEGLPDNFVTCFALGHDGSIWIGTQKGLSCYKDGNILMLN